MNPLVILCGFCINKVSLSPIFSLVFIIMNLGHCSFYSGTSAAVDAFFLAPFHCLHTARLTPQASRAVLGGWGAGELGKHSELWVPGGQCEVR